MMNILVTEDPSDSAGHAINLSVKQCKCCRDTREEASPLQLGMTSELLADSFLKTLFTRFYYTLQLHSPITHKGLQASALAH